MLIFALMNGNVQHTTHRYRVQSVDLFDGLTLAWLIRSSVMQPFLNKNERGFEKTKSKISNQKCFRILHVGPPPAHADDRGTANKHISTMHLSTKMVPSNRHVENLDSVVYGRSHLSPPTLSL